MQEASTNSPYDWKNNQSEEDQLTMIEEGSPKANQNPKMTTNHLTHFVYVQRRLKKLTAAEQTMKQI
jgi:hypothetical protein